MLFSVVSNVSTANEQFDNHVHVHRKMSTAKQVCNEDEDFKIIKKKKHKIYKKKVFSLTYIL